MILAAAAQPQGGIITMLSPLIMFAVMGGFFYFMIIRPQKKQRQEFQDKLETLKVGDHVVTRGGIRGEVIELTNDSFVIKTGNTHLEFLKPALSHIEDGSDSQSPYASTPAGPVGNLSYGKDQAFISKLQELKGKYPERELDILLIDVFEFVVKEDAAEVDRISSNFRLPRPRAEEIMYQLEDLGIVSKDLENNKRDILIDPRY